MGQNGKMHSVEVCKTLDVASTTPVVVTQFGDIAGTITARSDSSACADRGQNIVCMQDGQANGGVSEDVSTTLNASHEQPIIIDRAAFNQGENAKYPPHIEQSDTMDTLVARGPHAVCHRTASK